MVATIQLVAPCEVVAAHKLDCPLKRQEGKAEHRGWVLVAHVTEEVAHYFTKVVHVTEEVAHYFTKVAHVTEEVAHYFTKVVHVTEEVAHYFTKVAHVTEAPQPLDSTLVAPAQLPTSRERQR